MARYVLLLLPLILLGSAAGASAEEDTEALAKRLADLRRRVIECIDRIEALEKRVKDLAIPMERAPVEPEPKPPEPSGEPAVEGAFACRSPRARLRDKGGSRATERAVQEALKWLAAHQSPSGGWEPGKHMRWCDLESQPIPNAEWQRGYGRAQYEVGVTGLALLAFLGTGVTGRGEGLFDAVVERGLRYLRHVQDGRGCFGPTLSRHYIYCHAIATLAVVEAYGLTGDPRLHRPAQRGLDYIAAARNPWFAWRYGVKPGDNDTSVTGWMMLALRSARLVNENAARRSKEVPFELDEGATDGIRDWIKKMTDIDYGRTGYIQRGGAPARPEELIEEFPGDKSESLTAVGMLARMFVGEDRGQSRLIKKGAKLCAAVPPKWHPADGSIDMYYWFFGTMALRQVGGPEWTIWNRCLKEALLHSQRKKYTHCQYKGSWDPVGPWGPDGGRVYSTAMCALCLETYYRYERQPK